MDWEAHVDYLRLSIPASASAADRQRFAGLLERARDSQGGKHEERSWAWNGYVGRQVGAAQWGVRSDGEYLQISGLAASCVVGAALPDRFKCSRLDLAVTVLLPKDAPGLAEAIFNRIRPVGARGEVSHGRRTTLVDSPGHGSTLYIGSRTSRAFARIYDKGRESKGYYPLGTWRYELEAHNEQSTKYLPLVVDPATSVAASLGLVKDWLERRGVRVPVKAGPTVDSSLHTSQADRTDFEWLGWLERQVAPGIRKRIDRVGRDAIMKALGLDDEAWRYTHHFLV